jgi:hypothetical protein
MNLNDEQLTIPNFLRRTPKRGRPRKIEQKEHSVESKYLLWDKIKQERYGTRYDIQLGDEAPRIGSGLRIVYVKEGRKWAHMTSHSGDPDDSAGRVRKRLSLKRWLDMKVRHEKRQARYERAVKKIRKKANEANA